MNTNLWLVVFLLFSNVLSNSNETNQKIYLKYNFILGPRYSLNNEEYYQARNEWAFKNYKEEFKNEYKKYYEDKSILKSENTFMYSNILMISAVASFGLSYVYLTSYFLDKNNETIGKYFMIGSGTLLSASIVLKINSYKILKNSIK